MTSPQRPKNTSTATTTMPTTTHNQPNTHPALTTKQTGIQTNKNPPVTNFFKPTEFPTQIRLLNSKKKHKHHKQLTTTQTTPYTATPKPTDRQWCPTSTNNQKQATNKTMMTNQRWQQSQTIWWWHIAQMETPSRQQQQSCLLTHGRW